MDDSADDRLGKRLAHALRHAPAQYGLTLDTLGRADARAVADALGIDLVTLARLVEADTKGRFAFDDGERLLRAVHGHSVPVDLGLASSAPPRLLFHGTARRFLASIRRTGLETRDRQWVHLSADADTARVVGERHGDVVVLTVRAGELAASGRDFYRSTSGVWLTGAVPPAFLDFPTES